MQQSFEFRDPPQTFYEYICPCGAKMSMKFMQKQGFRCPECGRKKSKSWRRIQNTSLDGVRV